MNRGDENYGEVTELSIRVGHTNVNGGITNPTCGGESHIFHRGAARMVPCVPEIEGRFVTIFVLKANSSLSLCEVEVEVSDIGMIISVRLLFDGRGGLLLSAVDYRSSSPGSILDRATALSS